MSNTPFGVGKRKRERERESIILKTDDCKGKRLDNHLNRQLLKFSCKDICEHGQVLFKKKAQEEITIECSKRNKEYQAYL